MVVMQAPRGSVAGTAVPARSVRVPELSAPGGGAVADPEVDERADESVGADTPWQTVVWNDPVNLMSYVTWVLQKIFGYDRARATALMLDVHHKGRATVSSGSREKVEGDVAKLHAAGLWATMQRSS